jgi:ABC-type transport system involved in cytochrome bd biosynthesis fused ATPase/permease subunit
LVLNDAVAVLDRAGQTRLLESLLANAGSTTIVWATQDAASAARFERVMVFAEGRLVQDGTYADLVARDGALKELVAV